MIILLYSRLIYPRWNFECVLLRLIAFEILSTLMIYILYIKTKGINIETNLSIVSLKSQRWISEYKVND